SLKATLLVNRIEEATGVRISIRDIFQRVTVAGICFAVAEGGGMYEPIPKAEEKEYYPLSFSQKMYFLTGKLWDYNGLEISHNIPMAFKVTGAFDPEKAEAMFETLMQRYEILRTSFHLVNGETVMKIHDRAEMDITYEEYSAGESIETLASDFVRPFDLTAVPLMRAKVIKIEEEAFLLCLDSHHIISDGISSELLLEEFITLYTGGSLSPVRLQYKDYSEWMLGRQLDSQWEYWNNHFAKGMPKLQLPEDYPRSKEKKFEADVIVKKLDQKLCEKIVRIGQKLDMTEYMSWLSMIMILLGKYSVAEGVVVGSSVSGRTHRDTENMQGVFVNRLLMSSKPEKEKSLIGFLQEVKENCLMAYENQDVSFAALAKKFDPQSEKDESRMPLYKVHYTFLERADDVLDVNVEGLRFEDVKLDIIDREAKFDLACSIRVFESDYMVVFKYRTDLFKENTIEVMVEEFIQILERLDEAQDQILGNLSHEV
ncbi:MAG: condensation domain-containing protein, partial [Lachnospiraceae bacterium]|nr:condensation domain-containing protein [Lachnospiraceae bacterium]